MCQALFWTPDLYLLIEIYKNLSPCPYADEETEAERDVADKYKNYNFASRWSGSGT